MDLGLKGKAALVTAASRGFGKAVAMRLAAEGARVALCARGESDLAKAVEDVRTSGREVFGEAAGEVRSRALDVTDGAAVTDFTAELERQWGSIDLLLVNAGGPPAGTFTELDLDQWEAA